MASREAVYLEVGPKRTFACATEWPGWSRSGKTEADALEALLAYGPRYAAVVARTGTAAGAFRVPPGVGELDVTDRLPGGGGTDFGVPGETAPADERPIDEAELGRLDALLRAAWTTFDDAAQAHGGATLRTGPRGGGRDIPKMTEHVLGAEQAYLSLLGSRAPAGGMEAIRTTALATLAARARDEEIADPSRSRRLWLPRYYVRRSAWHALDHAWEIEDRAAG